MYFFCSFFFIMVNPRVCLSASGKYLIERETFDGTGARRMKTRVYLYSCCFGYFSSSNDICVCSVALPPHGLQHGRLHCPSLSPRVCSKLMSIESMMPSNHLILCHSLLLPPSNFPSSRVFSNESALHIRYPNYWSFSISLFVFL